MYELAQYRLTPIKPLQLHLQELSMLLFHMEARVSIPMKQWWSLQFSSLTLRHCVFSKIINLTYISQRNAHWKSISCLNEIHKLIGPSGVSRSKCPIYNIGIMIGKDRLRHSLLYSFRLCNTILNSRRGTRSVSNKLLVSFKKRQHNESLGEAIESHSPDGLWNWKILAYIQILKKIILAGLWCSTFLIWETEYFSNLCRSPVRKLNDFLPRA